MRIPVQKWGNSLVLRIPKSFATKAKLAEDTPVELSLDNGALTIKRIDDVPLNLDELIRGVTKDNRHGKFDTGAAVGKEVC